MSAPSSPNGHILNKKHKDLTKFEYVINRELISTAPVGKYIIIRVDGRRFKNFAEGEAWYRPIDDRPYKLMNRVAAEVMQIYDGTIMFASGQSDEMSFFLQYNTDLYQRRVDKIMSTIVSTFTVYYTTLYKEYINGAICPFDIDLHQAGPYFYSNTNPPIHPCNYDAPVIIPTGDLEEPISINTIGGGENDGETEGNASERIYPWCQRYGHPYAQWCPYNHHNITSKAKQECIQSDSAKQKQPKKPLKLTKHLPVFDGKVILLENEQEVRDYISWRQVDTHINNQYNTLFYLLTTPPPISPSITPTQSLPHSQTSRLPLRPERIYTPQEAEGLINGTNSLEKALLIQKFLNVDYFALPASYKRNSLLFWSDYLPITLHRGQEELFESDGGDEKGDVGIKYGNQLNQQTLNYQTKQRDTVQSFITAVNSISLDDNDVIPAGDFVAMMNKMIGWFFHTQNRNLTFPKPLLDFITISQSSQSSSPDPIQITKCLNQLKVDFLHLVSQLGGVDASCRQPSPHFTLPNPSELMGVIMRDRDDVDNDDNDDDDDENDKDNNNSNHTLPNPSLARRVLIYHGDLIESSNTDEATKGGQKCNNNNSNVAPKNNNNTQNKTNPELASQQPQQPTLPTLPTPLSPQSHTFPIPFIDPEFWKTHSGLFPHVSIRQKQLQLKKDLKKMRKKKHVENRRVVREKLHVLSPEQKQHLDIKSQCGNDGDLNMVPFGIESHIQTQGDITATTIPQTPDPPVATTTGSNTTSSITSPNKHIDANPNWAKKRRQYERYYDEFGIDGSIKAKSVEIQAKMAAEGDTGDFAIFNKVNSKSKNQAAELNSDRIQSLVKWVEGVYNEYMTGRETSRWLSRGTESMVLDYLLVGWTNARKDKR